jgi:hypothetical protein
MLQRKKELLTNSAESKSEASAEQIRNISQEVKRRAEAPCYCGYQYLTVLNSPKKRRG